MPPINMNDRILRSNYFEEIIKYCKAEQEKLNCAVNTVKFIVVMHIAPTIKPYLEALAKLGEIRAVILKGTRTHTEQTIYDEIKSQYTFYEDGRDGLAKEGAIHFINRYIGENEKCIILDIGGYFAPYVKILSENPVMKRKLLGIVEDTKNGHVEYEKTVADATFPIISIAESNLKALEDFHVGRGIVHGANAILSKDNTLSAHEQCGVIGYGHVGPGVVEQLKGNGTIDVVVNDKDPVQLLRAEMTSAVKTTDNKKQLLAQSGVVFCITGNQSIAGDEWLSLKNNAFVVSCTSSDTELDMKGLLAKTKNKKGIEHPNNPKFTQYNLINGKSIFLVCNGNAANFEINAVNGPIIYGVLSALIVAANSIITGSARDVGKILTLPKNIFDHIGSMWYEKFGKDLYKDFTPEEKIEWKAQETYSEDRQDSVLNHSFNLRPPVDFFVGRDLYLSQIESHVNDHIDRSKSTVIDIVGQPGMGKTQLALYYAHVNRRFFNDQIIFFDASDIKNLPNQFQKLADQLGIKEPNHSKQVKSIYKTLASNQRNLLIFDNSKPYSDIESYLPKEHQDKFVILLTKCHADNTKTLTVSLKFNRFSIKDEMSEPDPLQQDGILQFKKIAHGLDYETPENSDEHLYELLEKIAYFPVAITVIAKYLNQFKVTKTIKKYMDEDYSRGVRDNNSTPLALTYAGAEHQGLEMVLTLTLKALSPAEKWLLNCCAYLFSDDIPIDLLESIFRNANKKPEETLDSVIANIEMLGLLEIVEQGKTVRMHPIIQKFVHEYEKKQRNTPARYGASLLKLFEKYIKSKEVNPIVASLRGISEMIGVFKNPQQLLQIRDLFPHLQVLLAHAEEFKIDDIYCQHVRYLLGVYNFHFTRDVQYHNGFVDAQSKEYHSIALLTKAENELDKMEVTPSLTKLLTAIYQQMQFIHLQYAEKYMHNDGQKAYAYKAKADHYKALYSAQAVAQGWDRVAIIKDSIEFYLHSYEFMTQDSIAGSEEHVLAENKTRSEKMLHVKAELKNLHELINDDSYASALYYFYSAKKLIVGGVDVSEENSIRRDLNDALSHLELVPERLSFAADIFYDFFKLEKSVIDRVERHENNVPYLRYIRMHLVCLIVLHKTILQHDVAVALADLSTAYYNVKSYDKSMQSIYFAIEIMDAISRKNVDYVRKFIRSLESCGYLVEAKKERIKFAKQGFKMIEKKQVQNINHTKLVQTSIRNAFESKPKFPDKVNENTLMECLDLKGMQDILVNLMQNDETEPVKFFIEFVDRAQEMLSRKRKEIAITQTNVSQSPEILTLWPNKHKVRIVAHSDDDSFEDSVNFSPVNNDSSSTTPDAPQSNIRSINLKRKN